MYNLMCKINISMQFYTTNEVFNKHRYDKQLIYSKRYYAYKSKNRIFMQSYIKFLWKDFKKQQRITYYILPYLSLN